MVHSFPQLSHDIKAAIIPKFSKNVLISYTSKKKTFALE